MFFCWRECKKSIGILKRFHFLEGCCIKPKADKSTTFQFRTFSIRKNHIICTMQLWDDIRNYFYRKNIEKKLEGLKPERILTNLHDAKTIGIVYNSTNPDNDIIITKFTEHLRTEGKTVDILGFVDDKKIDHKADVLIFNTKNLSWNRTPDDERVEKFAAKNFDLLFAAFTEENFPLEYVARTSKAKWRLGIFDEKKTDYYDMMINMSGKSDLQHFLNQSTHFLNKIQYDSK